MPPARTRSAAAIKLSKARAVRRVTDADMAAPHHPALANARVEDISSSSLFTEIGPGSPASLDLILTHIFLERLDKSIHIDEFVNLSTIASSLRGHFIHYFCKMWVRIRHSMPGFMTF